MEPYQQRVIDELNELNDKVSKLGTYIYTEENYVNLPFTVKVLMEEQLSIMESYQDILKQRIALFDFDGTPDSNKFKE